VGLLLLLVLASLLPLLPEPCLAVRLPLAFLVLGMAELASQLPGVKVQTQQSTAFGGLGCRCSAELLDAELPADRAAAAVLDPASGPRYEDALKYELVYAATVLSSTVGLQRALPAAVQPGV
jgi:hypothetical protein